LARHVLLEVQYGGGESNVAVSLVHFGLPTEFVTRLPSNDMSEACLQFLRQYQVGTRFIQRGGARLGIYFLENGAVMRGSQVIYDRANSSFATIQPGMVDWNTVFQEAGMVSLDRYHSCHFGRSCTGLSRSGHDRPGNGTDCVLRPELSR
jgi:sugar/nucleoside kinase (ribokinase family)